MENMDKVIESLNSIINDLLRRIASLEYDNERLNNIINELEKWLKENNERLHKAIGRKCVFTKDEDKLYQEIDEIKAEINIYRK